MSRFLQSAKVVVGSILLGIIPLRAQVNNTALGQQAFSVCTGCHGLDGAGGEHAPNIATDPSVQRMTDAELLGIIRNGIPAAGMPSFGKGLNENQQQAVLAYLRILQGSRSHANVPGNPRAGREIFFGRGACAECHMITGRGGFLAADLSDYGKSHSPAVIREAIVAPGKNRDPRFGSVIVLTKTGKTYRGVLRNQDNFSIQMQTPDGVFHFFDKRDLARVDNERLSMMPTDYGTKLTQSEIDDLISFLSQSSGGAEKREEDDGEEEQ
jgi:cytochrome c oxidase cbb3-type subunit III